MLRLFAKRGVRLAPFPVVRQPPLRRTFLTGDVDDSPEREEQNKGDKPNQHGREDLLVCYLTCNSWEWQLMNI